MNSNHGDEIDALASRLETIIELNDDVLDQIEEFDFEPAGNMPDLEEGDASVMFG